MISPASLVSGPSHLMFNVKLSSAFGYLPKYRLSFRSSRTECIQVESKADFGETLKKIGIEIAVSTIDRNTGLRSVMEIVIYLAKIYVSQESFFLLQPRANSL